MTLLIKKLKEIKIMIKISPIIAGVIILSLYFYIFSNAGIDPEFIPDNVDTAKFDTTAAWMVLCLFLYFPLAIIIYFFIELEKPTKGINSQEQGQCISFCLGVLFSLSLLLFGFFNTSKIQYNIKNYKFRAFEYVSAGENLKALQYFDKAIKVENTSSDSYAEHHADKAEFLISLKRYDEAIKTINSYKYIFDKRLKSLKTTAEKELNEYNKTITSIDKAIKSNPDDIKNYKEKIYITYSYNDYFQTKKTLKLFKSKYPHIHDQKIEEISEGLEKIKLSEDNNFKEVIKAISANEFKREAIYILVDYVIKLDSDNSQRYKELISTLNYSDLEKIREIINELKNKKPHIPTTELEEIYSYKKLIDQVMSTSELLIILAFFYLWGYFFTPTKQDTSKKSK